MSKSNIALAILAGAVIGGIIAVVVTAENALTDDNHEEEEEESNQRAENIARQFSERLSSELQTAELKIKSAVKQTDFNQPQGEFGVFL